MVLTPSRKGLGVDLVDQTNHTQGITHVRAQNWPWLLMWSGPKTFSINKSSRSLQIRDWMPMTIVFWNLKMVKKTMIVQIHFTLEGDNLRV